MEKKERDQGEKKNEVQVMYRYLFQSHMGGLTEYEV